MLIFLWLIFKVVILCMFVWPMLAGFYDACEASGHPVAGAIVATCVFLSCLF